MNDVIDAPFEVEAAPAVGTKETATAVALRQVSAEVAEFDAVEAGLQALEKKYAGVVYDVSSTKGMVEAKAARAEIREPRYAVQNAADNAKKPLAALSKAIGARKDAIVLRIKAVEDPIHEQIEAEVTRKEAEKAAREEAARKVAADIQERIDFLRSFMGMRAGIKAAGIQVVIDNLKSINITLEAYGDRAGEAAQVKQQTLNRLDDMLNGALEFEAEQARVAAEREELARQRAEQEAREAADRARIAAEQKAAADKLADERRVFEQQQAAARAEAKQREDADRARRDEEDRLAREARAAEDKRIADARAVLEAEQRAVREAEEARAAAARKVEQDRIDAEAAAERKRLDDEAAALRAEQQRVADEARAKAQAEARKAAKAAAKLAAAQKAGPRLLAALHAAYDECAQLPEGTVSTEMMDEAIAAIAEGEGA